jgi:hypothetical protein
VHKNAEFTKNVNFKEEKQYGPQQNIGVPLSGAPDIHSY